MLNPPPAWSELKLPLDNLSEEAGELLSEERRLREKKKLSSYEKKQLAKITNRRKFICMRVFEQAINYGAAGQQYPIEFGKFLSQQLKVFLEKNKNTKNNKNKNNMLEHILGIDLKYDETHSKKIRGTIDRWELTRTFSEGYLYGCLHIKSKLVTCNPRRTIPIKRSAIRLSLDYTDSKSQSAAFEFGYNKSIDNKGKPISRNDLIDFIKNLMSTGKGTAEKYIKEECLCSYMYRSASDLQKEYEKQREIKEALRTKDFSKVL